MAKIRFHLDENVPNAVAEGLRRRGVDITTTEDAGLKHHSDQAQLAYAYQTGRVLITHDRHFLAMHEMGYQHCGIAYCPQGTRTIGQVLRSLVVIYEILDSGEMLGHIEYL